MASGRPQRILMVCMGNICRSPLAECIFRHKAALRGVADRFEVDSAGTGSWHVGEPPDPRVRHVASKNGVTLTGAARQVTITDFTSFDHILCMDEDNREGLMRLGAPKDKIRLLLDVLRDSHVREVPDPYYGGAEGFEEIYRLVDAACDSLLDELMAVKR